MDKSCSRCKMVKQTEQFHKCSRLKSGVRPECKECTALDAAQRKLNNPDHIKKLSKQSRDKYKEQNNLKSAKRYQANIENYRQTRRVWKTNNPDYARNYHAKWYKKNRAKKLKQNRNWEIRELRNTNSDLRIKKALRSRISQSLAKNRTPKLHRTMLLVGCDIVFLRQHLENRFVKGMTWENYGNVWHIDHIHPCAKFDLTDVEEIKKCFHYTNLQPLFGRLYTC